MREYVLKICNDNNIGPYVLDFTKIKSRDLFIEAVIAADSECDLEKLTNIVGDLIVAANEKEEHLKTK